MKKEKKKKTDAKYLTAIVKYKIQQYTVQYTTVNINFFLSRLDATQVLLLVSPLYTSTFTIFLIASYSCNLKWPNSINLKRELLTLYLIYNMQNITPAAQLNRWRRFYYYSFFFFSSSRALFFSLSLSSLLFIIRDGNKRWRVSPCVLHKSFQWRMFIRQLHLNFTFPVAHQ